MATSQKDLAEKSLGLGEASGAPALAGGGGQTSWVGTAPGGVERAEEAHGAGLAWNQVPV